MRKPQSILLARLQVSADRDGSMIMTFKVADVDEFKRWLIGLGPEAELLQPHTLRLDMCEECRHLAGRPRGE
jgi:predicted DNA-binding transcriptional regulator YafY